MLATELMVCKRKFHYNSSTASASNLTVIALRCMQKNHAHTSDRIKRRRQSIGATELCCWSQLVLIRKQECVTNTQLPVCRMPSHPILPGCVMRSTLPNSTSWQTHDCHCARSAVWLMMTSAWAAPVVWATSMMGSSDGVQARWHSHEKQRR